MRKKIIVSQKELIVAFFLLFLNLLPLSLYSQPLAFPGAEGYGKYTTGGRGGIVIKVTNLFDSGTGSLRDALTNSSYKYKKRTIVFSVSGTIELQSEIQVKYDSCITIAGQTAPGDGICIKNFPVSLISSKNIIIRYIRFRLGDKQTCDSDAGDCELDAFTIKRCHHIILDHCSFSWSIDDVLDLTDTTGYATVQYCILSEPLNNSKHDKGEHGYIAGLDGNSRGYNGIFGGSTYHHNLMACAKSRTPRLDSYAGINNTGCRDVIDMVNNVIYNWSSYGAYGGEHADVNWQNNYYRYGPNTGKKYQIFQTDAECKIYVSGNYVYGYPAVTSDNSKGIYISGVVATAAQLDTILITQDTVTSYPIHMETALAAYSNVLANAGATLPFRDTVDKRIVSYVKNGTGAIIDSVAQVGGWPVLSSATAPIDTDFDGMPDEWEIIAGLNPSDASDRNGDVNANGYTDLEDYLNGVAIIATTFDDINLANNFDKFCKIYPNPITSHTVIELNVNKKSTIRISILDITGKTVEILFQKTVMPGVLTVPWDMKNCKLYPGVYVCRIDMDNFVFYKKALLDTL
jgi:hypothetical protein